MEPKGLNGRQRRLWAMHDFSAGRGLEIGPLHNTSIRREHADVSYLDVFDRDRLIANYDGNPGVDPAKIPEIDFPLSDGDRVRSIPEAVAGTPAFDWVMASHVIEHVPDLVGWLAQVAQVTVDGGHLVLVVPDRRYCFDVHRPGTSVGQLLQAHEMGDVVPSIRAVYDYKRGHAYLRDKAPQVWSGLVPGYEKRIYDLDEVRRQVDLARRGEYVDSHVWTFTPGTLVEQLIELRDLGLSQWRFVHWTRTKRDENEFFAVLTRLPRGGWTPADLAGEPSPEHAMPDWLHEQLELQHELADVKARLKKRRAEIKDLRGRLHADRADREAERRSWRWRIGGWATSPVRVLRRTRSR